MSTTPDMDISRSGRVRKKNSFLAGYDPMDNFEKPRQNKKEKSGPNFRRNFLDKEDAPTRVTLKIGEHFAKKSKKRPVEKKIKYEPIEVDEVDDYLRPELDLMLNEDGEGDLEIDLPLEYDDSEMPILAAEEIIDEELLDEEDGATEITKLNSISRIKSQAESTYMMEKIRKGPPGNSYHPTFPQMSNSPRLKVKKKRKGQSPRATAYVLWAKDYRAQIASKYPGMDFATISRKLGDMWATIPANQKKMWKARAAKDSKKGENIKNSTPKRVSPKPAGTSKKKSSTPIVPPGQTIYGQAEFSVPIRKGGLSNKISKKNSPRSETFAVASSSKTKTLTQSGKSMGGVRGNGSDTLVIKSEKNSPTNNNSSLSATSSSRSSQHAFSTGPGCSSSPSLQYSPKKEEEIPSYTVTSTTPVDVAAHFSLLGESMQIIGERLKEHEGPNISGSLSVLLDSFLCATGPLLCLTQQVPELNHIPPEKLSRMLDNVAYLMPGL